MFWHLCCGFFFFLPHSFPYMSFFLSSPEPILFRLAFESPEASSYRHNPREVSSAHSSLYKTLPRPPRDPRSMPPTPVLTRSAYSSGQLRCDLRSVQTLLFSFRVLHRLWEKQMFESANV